MKTSHSFRRFLAGSAFALPAVVMLTLCVSPSARAGNTYYWDSNAAAGFTSAVSQTDYATYNIKNGTTNAFGIQGAGIGGSAETTWTTAANVYTQGTASETLTATRTITALRNTGLNFTLALGSNNLETFGLLNGAGTTWTISGTGAVRQPGTAAASLFVNAGNGNISTTISAPITDNTGALTLVKIGAGILALSNTSNSFSGGVTVNAGPLVNL